MSDARRTNIANTFGALGYMSLIVQSLWACLVVGYPLFSQQNMAMFLPQPSEHTMRPLAIDSQFSPIVTVFVALFTVAVLVATIIALIRLPASIGNKGKKVTHRTAELLVPTIAHGKTTKKQKKRLIERLTWWVKASLIMLPLFALIWASTDTGLEYRVILAVGTLCAAWSGLCFGSQYIAGRIFRLPSDVIW